MVLVRLYCFSIIVLCTAGFLQAQLINEFHYKNAGAGSGEFVEIFFSNPQPSNPSQYRIYLYNGNDSLVYESRGLQNIQAGCNSEEGGCYYVWERMSSFVQDGPRDAIALAYISMTETTVLDFISYEGTIMALDGPAKGMPSIDIGIHEDSSTEVGWSLQKRDDGTWFAGPETKGFVNPIELLSFGGIYLKDKNGILLHWRTATELNNQYFEVQKSMDQRSFLSVAEVTGAGNSQQILVYSFFDQDVLPGKTFYRLKQVDFDGAFEYSQVITVEVHPGNTFSDMKPILRTGEIYFPRSDFQHPMEVSLHDALGRRLLYCKQVYVGDVIPVNASVEGIIFYHIRSHGLENSGHLVMMNR